MNDEQALERFRVMVDTLSQPGAWGGLTPEVRATHASVVFLVGERVYKIKRPLDLGFLDYSTLEKREWACHEEVRLNRPRAPGIYLGVVPITLEGKLVEWAVEMVRLPDDACLLHRVEAGLATEADLEAVARALAAHHLAAPRGPAISAFATRARVSDLVMGNLDQSAPEIGLTISEALARQLRVVLQESLERLGPVIDDRAQRQIVCETHGDLRLDHVYLLPDPEIGRRIVFVDCIEFSLALRCADPAADIAFLTMDLAARGQRALADVTARAWLAASGDQQAEQLLPLYESYRSAVRGKVAGISLRDPSLSESQRALALARAKRHWLFALDCLEMPHVPRIIGIGGLPGTGKSTLAAGLAREMGFEVIRSDVVRKELAGLPTSEHPSGAMTETLYTEEAKDNVYAACLDRAAELLMEGRKVIIDASFGRQRWRESLRTHALSLGVQAMLVICELPRQLALDRLSARRGDASDADEAVYLRAIREWQPPIDEDAVRIVQTDETSAALRSLVCALTS